jgi:hypothetical protein
VVPVSQSGDGYAASGAARARASAHESLVEHRREQDEMIASIRQALADHAAGDLG